VFYVPTKGCVSELGCFPTSGERLVLSRHDLFSQRSGHPGYHPIAQTSSVEGFDDLLVVEAPSSRMRVRLDGMVEGSFFRMDCKKAQASLDA
jgi:hypothetical protein